MQPPLDAFIVETVFTARQYDCLSLGLELHKTDGACVGNIWVFVNNHSKGFSEVENLGEFGWLKIGVGGKESFGHESVDLAGGVEDENDDHKKEEKEVNG